MIKFCITVGIFVGMDVKQHVHPEGTDLGRPSSCPTSVQLFCATCQSKCCLYSPSLCLLIWLEPWATPLNSAPTVCGDTSHSISGGEQNELIEVGLDGTFLRVILKKLYQKLCGMNLDVQYWKSLLIYSWCTCGGRRELPIVCSAVSQCPVD